MSGPRHCWHCNRSLARIIGGAGRLSFVVLLQQDGYEVRVHHICVSDAVGDGVRVKPT